MLIENEAAVALAVDFLTTFVGYLHYEVHTFTIALDDVFERP